MRDEFIPSIYTFITTLLRFKVDYPACLQELQSDKSDQLSYILRRYLSTMQEKNLMDAQMICDWAVRMLKDGVGFPINTLLILGIGEASPLESDLLLALCEHSPCSKWYNFAEHDWSPHGGSEGKHVLHFDHVMPDEEETVLTNSLDDTGGGHLGRPIFMSSFRNPLEEANAVASQISRLIRDGVEPQSICVLLPQRAKSAPLYRQVLKDHSIPAHITVRGSLAELPIVQTIFDAFEVVNSNYCTENIVRLLQSPYVRLRHLGDDVNERNLSAHDVRRYATEGRIMRGKDTWEKGLLELEKEKTQRKDAPNATGSDIEMLDRQLEKIRDLAVSMPQLIELLESLEGKKSIRGHAQALRNLISSLKIGEHLLYEYESIRKLEFSGLREFLSILESMEQIAPLSEEREIDMEQFVWSLRREVLSNEIPSLDSADSTVMVSGLREIALRPMSHTFIVGLVDGDMPDLNVSFPLADDFERSRMSILKSDVMLGQEREYFLSALIHTKSEIYLSYPRSEEDAPKIPSIFYDRISQNIHTEQFPLCESPSSTLNTQKDLGHRIGNLPTIDAVVGLETEFDAQEIYDTIEIERRHRTGPYRTIYDGVLSNEKDIVSKSAEMHLNKTFSYSMLERFNECPFKYLVRDILNIKPFEELEEGVRPTDRGTIFHRVAYLFHSEWKGKVNPADRKVAVDRIRQIGKEEIDAARGRGAVWDAFRIRMLGEGDIPGVLARFIDNEMTDPLPGFTPMMFEIGTVKSGRDAPLAPKSGPILLDIEEGPVSQMKFTFIIDRVDIGEGMKAFILDYKTGRVPTTTAVSNGDKLQLPLYILALEEMFPDITCVGAGYYSVGSEMEIVPMLADKAAKVLMGDLGKKKCVNDHYHQILEDVRKRLGKILSGMMKGEYHPSMTGNYCEATCDYYTTCRFQELRLLDRGGI